MDLTKFKFFYKGISSDNLISLVSFHFIACPSAFLVDKVLKNTLI